MRRKDQTRYSRDILVRARAMLWRGRVVQFAAVCSGLVATVAAAHIATKFDDATMSREIVSQRVAAAEPEKVVSDHQSKALTPDQMLAAAESYEHEIEQAVEHGETLRVSSYHSKDIIRLTCVDEKLGQMKQIATIAKPRFVSIKQAGQDELHMRSQFTIIREGGERIKELSKEMETCTGDSLDEVSATKINEEGYRPGTATDDPTSPPAPTNVVERPPAASPYQ
jgi:hypothetical protein